jgi:FMN phosphatase YigB (HAD superfamily)
MNDTRLLTISAFLVDYPFANRLYPGSLDAIEHLRRWGLTVILSDGDVVFQPRKVQRSGWLHNSFMILAGVFGWTISPATADFSASRSGQI